MNYSFKKISSSYLTDISKLYEDCFNLKVNVSELKQKYDTSVFGESYTGFIALDEDREVGAYYGVFPLIVNCKGKEYLVGQSGDTMTAVNHRKKGLFTKLAKETYQLCEELNMAFVFGFPNENSLPGFEKKLGWKFYGNMQMFTFHDSFLIPYCELASKFKSIQSPYKSFIKKKMSKYLISEDELNLSTNNSVVKDKRFFHYKMKNSNDIYLIKINDFKMVIKAKPHLMIGDVEPFEKDRLDQFLNTIKSLQRIVKAKKAQIIISENHWLYSILSEVEKPSASLPVGFYKINSVIDYSEISFSLLDYDTF